MSAADLMHLHELHLHGFRKYDSSTFILHLYSINGELQSGKAALQSHDFFKALFYLINYKKANVDGSSFTYSNFAYNETLSR